MSVDAERENASVDVESKYEKGSENVVIENVVIETGNVVIETGNVVIETGSVVTEKESAVTEKESIVT